MIIVGRGWDGVKALRVNNRALAFCDAEWLLRSLIENAPVSAGKVQTGSDLVVTQVTCLRNRRNLRLSTSMTLSALLVSTDESSADVLRRVLEELSIQVESCPDFARAAIRPAQQRFDVVIIDGDCQDVISLSARDSLVSAERCDACGGGGALAGKHSRTVLAGRQLRSL